MVSAEELMLLNCGVGEDSRESLGLQGDPTSPSERKSVLTIHWKDRCWSWNSSTLATWCEELTHWKRPWCWERLKAGGEGDSRGWDGWMASPTQWTLVWVSSGSWWWTGRPGMLQSMGLQRVGHNWETELNWISHGMDRPHFVHLFISWLDGHLGCSHVQVIMSNSVVNIHALIQVLVRPCSFHMVSLETKKSKSERYPGLCQWQQIYQ